MVAAEVTIGFRVTERILQRTERILQRSALPGVNRALGESAPLGPLPPPALPLTPNTASGSPGTSLRSTKGASDAASWRSALLRAGRACGLAHLVTCSFNKINTFLHHCSRRKLRGMLAPRLVVSFSPDLFWIPRPLSLFASGESRCLQLKRVDQVVTRPTQPQQQAPDRAAAAASYSAFVVGRKPAARGPGR